MAAAVFAAGAGAIGDYRRSAPSSAEGRGWFTPGPGRPPSVGQLSIPERTPEVRWETVVPRTRVAAAIAAYICGPIPTRSPPSTSIRWRTCCPEPVSAGRGRCQCETTVAELGGARGSPVRARRVQLERRSAVGSSRRVGVLPGSGRSLIEEAAGLATS